MLMVILYGLAAALVCYLALRNTRSIALHVLVFIIAMFLVTLATTYQFHLGTPSGKIWVSIRQYSFKRGLLNTVVTYTTLPAYEKSYRPTFLASAKSIRFTN